MSAKLIFSSRILSIALLLGCAGFAFSDVNDPFASRDETTSAAVTPCDPLPTGPLTDEKLQELVPEGSPGSVQIKWATESQEDNYGFNILRADSAEGPYKAVNTAIIPGEGTTNIPKVYCFTDRTPTRGQTYYYQIEEISGAGVRAVLEMTRATKVTAKTVEQEREWLKKKVAEAEATADDKETSR